MQQRDATRAVGVVLNGGDLRGNVVLVAAKVDDAVLLLVATAAVTRGLAAVVVASTGLGLGSSSDFSGVVVVSSAKSETVWKRRPGLVGLR